MLYNNPFTSNVDMSAKLVARLTKAFEQIRYIKEASQDMARVYDIIEETKGVMNVFAGQRIVESYLYGAVGYVNPYGNYIPRASYRDLRLHRRGPHRGCQEDRAADQPDAGHHQRGPSDLRPPVLLQGAGRGRRLSGRRRARRRSPPSRSWARKARRGSRSSRPIMRELDDLVDRIEAPGASAARMAAE